MEKSIRGNLQWRTWRKNVTVDETFLTNYEPGDLTATIKSRMISVVPYTAIVMMGMGKDTANESGACRISGWMDPVLDPGPGMRMMSLIPVLGSKTTGVDKEPIPGWGSGTWLHCDSLFAASTIFFGNHTELPELGINRETLLLLPTYGFTHLLMEVRPQLCSELSFAWRPVTTSKVMQVF